MLLLWRIIQHLARVHRAEFSVRAGILLLSQIHPVVVLQHKKGNQAQMLGVGKLSEWESVKRCRFANFNSRKVDILCNFIKLLDLHGDLALSLVLHR